MAARLPPQIDRVVLVSTEPEAMEAALRLTQAASGRPGVLAFHSSLRNPTADVRNVAVPTCKDHDSLDYETCEEPTGDAIAAITSRLDIDDIGAVVVEPVLTAAGNRLPRRGFPTALQNLCRERGWLSIFDESTAGFGRTGKPFAFEVFGVEPDVVVLGNGLGGGFPASAICASSALWDAATFDEPPLVTNAGRARPLACAAGTAALEIVTEPGFLDSVRSISARAAVRLRELVGSSSRVAHPRGIGLMLGFDLVDPRSGALATTTECEAVLRTWRNRGILIASTSAHIRLNLPLTLSKYEADCLFDGIAETVT